jgi:uncharacterized membrane protein YvbJ
MICPKCHKDNPTTNLVCDFCSAELPVSKERRKLIIKKMKIEKRNKWQKTKDTIIGMGIALFVIIAIILAKAYGLF